MINEIGSSASPAASAAQRAPGGNLGKDEFLQMLVAQMRNQDPLNPTDGQEMAAQLAQFSSLEQLTNVSQGLEQLAAMGGEIYQALNAASGMSLVGRTVLAETDQVEIGGATPASVTLELGGRGVSGKVRILDSNGKQVGAVDLGALAAGRHEIDLGRAAEGLPAGVYTFDVEVASASEEEVPVLTYVKAHVDGVRYGPEGPTLVSGGLRLPLPYVREVTGG